MVYFRVALDDPWCQQEREGRRRGLFRFTISRHEKKKPRWQPKPLRAEDEVGGWGVPCAEKLSQARGRGGGRERGRDNRRRKGGRGGGGLINLVRHCVACMS